jgi:hypothetical protein
MNMPGEHLQIANDPSHALGNGLVWRTSEGSATWKGDLLGTTRREHPMPYSSISFTPVAGDQVAIVPAEERFVLVTTP